MLQIGLAKTDITPRVGVGLYGYGSFLCRHSVGVREPLFARAMAFSDGDRTAVIVSCDLVGVSEEITEQVRQRVNDATGLPAEAVCVHCIHTHCGPRTKEGIGQGIADPPYLELLPRRIARTCIAAVRDLAPAILCHKVVPCVGIGYNREDEERPDPLAAAREDWRPARPERTDTQAHVLTVMRNDEVAGFVSYFSCHPVVGSAQTRWIHSDFVGIATNRLEREHPGAVGIFLQGCEGNVNSCFVHQNEPDSLLALDVLADRYARQIRPAIGAGPRLNTAPVRYLETTCTLSRSPLPRTELECMLENCEKELDKPEADDGDRAVKRATVYAIALRRELARLDAGETYTRDARLQGFRIGDLILVGAPFEVMIRYKQRLQTEFPDRSVLPLSLCNGTMGYAPERTSFDQENNYAAKIVPYLLGYPPLSAAVEDELVEAWTDLARKLSKD